AVLVLAGNRLAKTGTASAPDVAVAPLDGSAAAASGEPASAGLGSTGVTATGEVVVDVVGAVRRPGLYRLSSRGRVADAVARAGGTTRKADLAAINLAAPLVDGTQILVPSRVAGAAAGAAAAPSGPTAGGPLSPGAKVSLSSATLEQLDALPGVG